jgi:hypothetical protein
MGIQRFREVLRGPIDPHYLEERAGAGWKLVAVEWEREGEGKDQGSGRGFEDAPFGLQVAGDCSHLEENPAEMQVLKFIMELIVQDISLPRMAEELNRKGLPTRGGTKWGPVSVFKILPRVIEVAPRIVSSEEWAARRKQFAHIAWNS